MKEVIDVNVSFDTSFEDIELLRVEMENFVRAPENNRDFQPDVAIGVGGVGDCDKLTLKIAIKHKSNWHNEVVRATRRSKFMCALTLALKRVPIYGPGGGGDALGGPANPTYSVSVTDDFAADARAKSAKEKEAKKLLNQSSEQAATTDAATAAEQRAAEHFNTTNPVIEALDDWGYENTLASRDPSADRNPAAAGPASSSLSPPTASGAAAAAPSSLRSNGHSLRSDVLSARESQRGRRKAGETLPPNALLGEDNPMPALHLTRSSTDSRRSRSGNNGNNGKRSFDVERQAGMLPSPAAGAGSPYNTWAAYNTVQEAPSPGPSPAAGPSSLGDAAATGGGAYYPQQGTGPAYRQQQQQSVGAGAGATAAYGSLSPPQAAAAAPAALLSVQQPGVSSMMQQQQGGAGAGGPPAGRPLVGARSRGASVSQPQP